MPRLKMNHSSRDFARFINAWTTPVYRFEALRDFGTIFTTTFRAMNRLDRRALLRFVENPIAALRVGMDESPSIPCTTSPTASIPVRCRGSYQSPRKLGRRRICRVIGRRLPLAHSNAPAHLFLVFGSREREIPPRPSLASVHIPSGKLCERQFCDRAPEFKFWGGNVALALRIPFLVRILASGSPHWHP